MSLAIEHISFPEKRLANWHIFSELRLFSDKSNECQSGLLYFSINKCGLAVFHSKIAWSGSPINIIDSAPYWDNLSIIAICNSVVSWASSIINIGNLRTRFCVIEGYLSNILNVKYIASAWLNLPALKCFHFISFNSDIIFLGEPSFLLGLSQSAFPKWYDWYGANRNNWSLSPNDMRSK